jgi:ferric-dicitrate binding protein FerR (iron transport regulator)
MKQLPASAMTNLEIERQRRRRQRNWALFAALLGFVVLVYVVTIVKMGGA